MPVSLYCSLGNYPGQESDSVGTRRGIAVRAGTSGVTGNAATFGELIRGDTVCLVKGVKDSGATVD